MPFPDISPLIETFLEPTRIFLFGKPFPNLVYNPAAMSVGGPTAVHNLGETSTSLREFEDYSASAPASAVEEAPQTQLPMPPSLVEQTLRQAEDGGLFARIYGFSFEGHYYKLPRPLLFLVHDVGSSRDPEEPDSGGWRQFNTRFVGVEGKDWQFGSDIRVWAVDKHDIAICLDLDIGSYDQVLLQSLTAGQEESAFRTAATTRTAATSRTAATFRTAAVGPHQDR